MNQQLALFELPTPKVALPVVAPKPAPQPAIAPVHEYPVHDAVDTMLDESGWLIESLRKFITAHWPVDKLRERLAYFTDPINVQNGLDNMKVCNVPPHIIRHRTEDLARTVEVIESVLLEKEVTP